MVPALALEDVVDATVGEGARDVVPASAVGDGRRGEMDGGAEVRGGAGGVWRGAPRALRQWP